MLAATVAPPQNNHGTRDGRHPDREWESSTGTSCPPEDISSIASTVAEILRRQGQREDRQTTSGAGSTGGPSTATRTDLPAIQSQAGKVREYLRVGGQPRNVVATRPEGLAGNETTHQEGGRSRPLQDLWVDESCPAAHQNGMGLEAPPKWDRHVA